MTDSKKKTNGVEGEGSYTATHNYNEGVKKSVASGNAAKLGEKAKEALEGPEGDALREAEKAAKAGQAKPAKKSS